MTARPLTALALAALVAGCGAPREDAGMRRVQALVDERAPGSVELRWNRGSDDDRAAARAVAALLERELDAAAAAQIALLGNRDLQATYARIGVAQADLVQAGLLRNPVFGASARFGTATTTVELSLVQEFLAVFQLPLRKRLAEDALARATYEVAGAVIDLAASTRDAFYGHQGNLQVLELRRTAFAAASASFDLASRLHAAGNITDVAFGQERAQLEESRLALAESEIEILESREELNELMGLWGPVTVAWVAKPRLDAPPAEAAPPPDTERRAVVASLDLLASRGRVVAAARRYGQTVPWWLETADLGVAAEREPEGDWFVGPSVDVTIPLFDRGQARSRRADALLEAERARFVATAVAVRASARLASARVALAADRAHHLETIVVPLRAQLVATSLLQFNAMRMSAFELLAAKREQVEAEVQHVMAVEAYWHARSVLDRVLAGRRVASRGSSPAMDDEAESSTAQGP